MRRVWVRAGLLFGLVLLAIVGVKMLQPAPSLEAVNSDPPAAALTIRSVPHAKPEFVWWEAEQPSATNFPKQHPFAPTHSTEAAVLSGGQWIGVDGPRSQPLFLEYTVKLAKPGDYFFYSRKFWQHGPFRWRWDEQPWRSVGTEEYLLDSVPLRQFVGANWVSLGTVALSAGTHRLRIELTQNDGAAAFDCFVLTRSPFQPRGKLKPDQQYTAELPGWFLFDPPSDSFAPSPIDLRRLNEAIAGEQGWIQVKGEEFVLPKTQQPIRFWAVNLGTESLAMDAASQQYLARFLAKRGVNLVRLHGKLWSGENFRQIDPIKLNQLFKLVATLKQQGIYTALSIYFPAWLPLKPTDGFAGYSGQNPYSLLFFNPEFQQMYFGWWRSLLTTPNPATGKTLREEPAIALLELVNEDSYFFWTFDPHKGIPTAQMERLEQQFGTWLERKYGTVSAALAAWADQPYQPPQPDRPQTGRISLMPLYELVAQKDSRRAQDTATFLTESQRQFFQQAIGVLRQQLQYKGLISASNWVTADPHLLGPLDKYTNTTADFMDRHGYFDSDHQGDRATYTLSSGDTYRDRSALLFQTADGKPDFNLPLFDIRYNGLPSTISEINWTTPNRFRAEFPFLAATYGSLQNSNGFFFFASNQPGWDSSLDKFTIASPTILGQFPALARLYRQGLVRSAASVVDVTLKLSDLKALRGSPIVAGQNLDAFRAQDGPSVSSQPNANSASDRAIDPLAFLVGKVNLNFSETTTESKIANLDSAIDRTAKTVRSSTGQLHWNYGQGWVTLNAPQAQGVSGFLRQAGSMNLSDLTLRSDMDFGTVMLVSLDDRPLSQSQRMLLQVMSEEQNFGWKTSPGPRKRIESIGGGAIVVRNLSGTVELRRPDAATLQVTALDANGYAGDRLGQASRFNLQPTVLYYLIEKMR